MPKTRADEAGVFAAEEKGEPQSLAIPAEPNQLTVRAAAQADLEIDRQAAARLANKSRAVKVELHQL